MKLIPENWRDIQKYYEHTFVKFREYGDKLFFIQRVTNKAVEGTHDGGKEDFILSLNSAVPYELDFILPHKSMFQFKNKALMLYRVPARQYYRGLCEENTKIISPATGEPANLSWAVLSAYVEKQSFYTLKAAMSSKKSGSFALNSRMCVDSGGRLFLDSVQIGQLSNGVLAVSKNFMDEASKLVAVDPFNISIKSL